MFSFTTKKFNPGLLVILFSLPMIGIADSSAQTAAKTSFVVIQDSLPQVTIKGGENLIVDAREASEKQIPVLMFFSMQHCPFCMEVEEDYLKPILRNSEYDNKIVIRKIKIDDSGIVRDFKGNERDPGEFSEQYDVSMVPTLILVDSQGNKIVPAIIGIANSHYYSAELDDAIDASIQKIRANAKR